MRILFLSIMSLFPLAVFGDASMALQKGAETVRQAHPQSGPPGIPFDGFILGEKFFDGIPGNPKLLVRDLRLFDGDLTTTRTDWGNRRNITQWPKQRFYESENVFCNIRISDTTARPSRYFPEGDVEISLQSQHSFEYPNYGCRLANRSYTRCLFYVHQFEHYVSLQFSNQGVGEGRIECHHYSNYHRNPITLRQVRRAFQGILDFKVIQEEF